MPSGRNAPGDTVTWPAHTCPVSTSGATRGQTVDYSVTVDGTTTRWFTGGIPAE